MRHLHDRLLAEPPLARTSTAELELARAHRDALIESAVELVHAAGHDPDAAPCAAADCQLAGHRDGDDLCAVAHALSRLPDAPAPTGPPGPLGGELAHFRDALAQAADAVRVCRQTAHQGGGCWFSAAPGTDGCGPVLRLLHRAC